MKNMFIKMLADAKVGDIELKSGSIVKVDSATAKQLIDMNQAEDYTEQKSQEDFNAKVDKAVADKMAAAKKDVAVQVKVDKAADSTTKIEVKSPELDPCGGYIAQRDKYTEKHIHHAAGLFLKDVAQASDGNGRIPEKLKAWQDSVDKAAGDGMRVGDDSEGGFLVFPQFSTMLLDSKLEDTIVRPRATVIPISGTNKLNLPVWDDVDHSSSLLFGGIQAVWKGEEKELDASKPRLAEIALEPHKLTTLGYVTDEMLRFSAVSMGAAMVPLFQAAINWKEDDAYINGTGAGQPLGILNAAAKVEVAKETGQAADSIVYENVLNMFARLKIMNNSSVVWIANRTIIPQLAAMNLTIGTGGAPVYTPANAVAGQPWQMLFGYPILFTEKVPTLGDAGDLVLTDLSQYLIGDDTAGPDVQESIHVKFVYAQTAFRILKYSDGQSWMRKPFTPKNGDTLAPIVTLAARA